MTRSPLERLSLIREFTARYRARIAHGLAEYGEFDPTTDTRVLAQEALEECLDIGSYLEFLEEKFPEMGTRIRRVRVKAILLYGDLKGLVEDEASRTRERGSAV
jgi:hypothetical protein